MDLDVFVNTHHIEWDRLDHLLHRGRSLTGEEADELVVLYQRTATHLSLIQSSAPDPVLTARLTQLVARARSTVTGTRRASWRDAARFLTAGFPAAVYRSRHWWIPTAVLSTLLAAVIGWWIGTHPEVQASLAAPEDLRALTRPGGEYETYYSSHPAASFAAQVWTNNAQAAAICLVLGAFLCIPVIWILLVNVLNLAVGIGLMSSMRPSGHLPRARTATRAARTHRRLRRGGDRPATRLDGHRPGPTDTALGPGPAGKGSDGHGHRPGPCPVRLRRHRRVRHPVRTSHLGAHLHRDSR